MPFKAKHPCNQPGCGKLTDTTYCPDHTRQAVQRDAHRKAQIDRYRGSSAERGYDGRWRQYRVVYLSNHPLCVACLEDGRSTLATVVDHIEPHQGSTDLFWEEANHQALCKPHHDSKTARENGGFGNPRKRAV